MSTSEQAVVGLTPGVAMLAGQDAHGLLVRLPGLGADADQLPVDLALGQRCAVAVIHVELKELQTETTVHHSMSRVEGLET